MFYGRGVDRVLVAINSEGSRATALLAVQVSGVVFKSLFVSGRLKLRNKIPLNYELRPIMKAAASSHFNFPKLIVDIGIVRARIEFTTNSLHYELQVSIT